MKSVHVVVGLAAAIAGFVSQSSTVLPRSESPLLVVWGALLLLLGHLVKARHSHQAKPAPAAELASHPVSAARAA